MQYVSFSNRIIMDIEDGHIESNTSEDDSEKNNANKTQTEEKSTPNTRSRTRQTKYSAIYSSDDSESEHETENEPKATNLFTENDVEGKLIYGFKTTKKRNGMVNKALCVASSASKDLNITKLTPVKNLKIKDMTLDPKTPHAVRKRIRKELASLAHKSDNSGEDFSDTGSEYNPEEPESSSSSEENIEENDNSSGSSDKEMEIISKVQKLNIRPIKQSTVSKRGRPRKDTNYVLQSDNYFATHATSKVVTSDHTLDKLKNPRLSQDKIQQLLKTMKLSETHEKSLNDLFEEYKNQFPHWMFILQEGFSILLHGLGSKRNILNAFHQEVLMEENVVVVNGFFPSLTIKDILDSITNILELNINSTNVHEVVDSIEEELCQNQEDLYLIIHNIDGPMLRNNKTQNVLARLAKMEGIHLLTSIDHINAPLLWDHTKLSSFNFCWFDATSLLPYTYETSFEGSLLVHNSGALALSSLKNVFESLTSNSRGIYLLIVKNQLANKTNQNYQGMAFKDLYWSCRESFLVSSDLALRAQLTEFLDHKLVKMKRTMDGIEHLQIPIDNSLLQQFIDQQNK